jgi:hypothetical protein
VSLPKIFFALDRLLVDYSDAQHTCILASKLKTYLSNDLTVLSTREIQKSCFSLLFEQFGLSALSPANRKAAEHAIQDLKERIGKFTVSLSKACSLNTDYPLESALLDLEFRARFIVTHYR